MTYILPQIYNCPTCETTMNWTPQGQQIAPITSEGNPICPVCWNKFLSTLNAEMECTADFGKGSNYENRYKKAQEK